jgi:NAD+ kinase
MASEAGRRGAREALVVYKKSKLTLYVREKRNKRVGALVEEGASIVGALRPAHEAHAAALATVKRVLAAARIPFRSCYRARLKPEDAKGRLIIAVGGDGTVLDASHKVDGAPILGVNSDPERSVGFLCAARAETFSDVLYDVLEERLLPTPVPRLTGFIDGQPLPFPVLNELLVAHKNPAATVRYRIEAKGAWEDHKSSGIWIAGPAGSTAAMASAGGVVQPIEDARWQLRVREPYLVDGPPRCLLSLLLPLEEEVRLTSRMPEGVVYLDGPHVRLPFGLGAVLRLSGQGAPLALFVTHEMRARRAGLKAALAARSAALEAEVASGHNGLGAEMAER